MCFFRINQRRWTVKRRAPSHVRVGWHDWDASGRRKLKRHFNAGQNEATGGGGALALCLPLPLSLSSSPFA